MIFVSSACVTFRDKENGSVLEVGGFSEKVSDFVDSFRLRGI